MKARDVLASGAIVFLVCVAAAQNTASHAIHEDHPGYPLYRQYCASCHGVFADGLGPVVPVLRSRPPDLTRLAFKYGTPLPKPALVSFIGGRDMLRAHGTTDMPVWGIQLEAGLPPTTSTTAGKRMTLGLIVDYLDTIQQKP